MIYFDNAATTGHKPPAVINAVDNALKNLCANPGRSGHKTSLLAANTVFAARERAAKFFGLEAAENVVFTANCTEAVNFVLKGVLEKGDHVIISNLEHNAVIRPLVKMGINYDMAEVSLYDDEKTAENFKRLIKPKTKMIFTTAASNVLGKRVPIRRIGEICQKKGILFGVDAAQAAGVVPIDMKEDHIDYLCVAAHKGLYAPMGIGVLMAFAPIKNTIIEGGTGTDSKQSTQPEGMPERFESGTVNVPHIAGCMAGIDFVEKTGIGKIFTHEMRLLAAIYDELKKMPHIILYTPRPQTEQYVPVLSFNVKGVSSEHVARLLDQNDIAVRAGLHCAPSAHKVIGTLGMGAVRISPSYFNKPQEAVRLCRVLKNIKFL